jgi:hydrogenase-4 membrane subunit HyfE
MLIRFFDSLATFLAGLVLIAALALIDGTPRAAAMRRRAQAFVLLASIWLERGYPRLAAAFLEIAAQTLRQEGGERKQP